MRINELGAPRSDVRRYYRRHTFDHYMLFSVDAAEKRKETQAPPADSAEKPLPN